MKNGDWAARYAEELGWRIFRLRPRSKTPLRKGWQEEATSDPKAVRELWAEEPEAGPAVFTGATGSGIVVLDIDRENAKQIDGFESLEHLIDSHPDFQFGPIQITGRADGGAQTFFTHPGKPCPQRIGFRPGMDLKGDGNYVALAPCIHPLTSRRYEWDEAPFGRSLPRFPDCLYEAAYGPEARRGTARRRNIRDLLSGGDIPEGIRNASLASLAGFFRAIGFEESELTAKMMEITSSRCKPPLPETTVVEMCKRFCDKYQPNDVLTDVWTAHRLVELNGEDFRYCHDAKLWLEWNEKVWADDETGEIRRRAMLLGSRLRETALTVSNSDRQRQLVVHAKKVESQRAINAMLDLSRSIEPIATTTATFDSDHFLLNVQNGIVDLRSGELKQHDRQALLRSIANASFKPEAACPRWLDLLDLVFDGNQEIVDFLQRAVGYSATGSQAEQVMFIPHGHGENGKSTVIKTINGVLGGYAKQTPATTFLQKRLDGGIPSDVARLKGGRFVWATESDEGKLLSEGFIKAATGETEIIARRLYHDWEPVPTTFKLWLATNHKPQVKGTDHALWRRLLLIPFTVRISSKRPKIDDYDQQLLAAEADGILRWIIEGCLTWQQVGLAPPATVTKATATYRREEDQIGRFIAECCNKLPTARCKPTSLFRAYAKWCELGHETAVNQTVFGRTLEERGFGKVTIKGVLHRKGLSLNNAGEALLGVYAEPEGG